MKFSAHNKGVLLPPDMERTLVDFNNNNRVYVRVPYAALMKHKDALIEHALGKGGDLSGWHTIVKNPHAFAHIVRDGNIVMEVPPILARVPTLNPANASGTLTSVVQDIDRTFAKLPVAADKHLERRLAQVKLPEYSDEYIINGWLNFLRAFKVIKDEPTKKTQQASEDDGFIFT